MALFAQTYSYYGQNYCPNLTTSSWYGNKYNNRIEVARLQKFLFSYYGTNINPTGFFGQSTKSYVARFQQEQGLYPVTGGVGPLTRNAIAQVCGGNGNGGGQIFCPTIYQPVCGQQLHECCSSSPNKPAYCTYAKVSCEVGAPKTYSNSCELNAAGAKYLYDGECKNNTVTEAPNNCKVWYDGCNICSRSYEGGPLACTLMACLNNNIWNSGAYCKEYFSNSTNISPVIKSFSGPTQLNVNEKGTWYIQAEIFNNQQLTYNISWGDEKTDYKANYPLLNYISAVTPQNTTFEHAYANNGTYIVTITVTSANGQSTKTTTTVNVIGNNISCYDNGTAYNEGASKSCLWVNGNQTCIADASYVCRSGSWKVEGSNWWGGQQNICTSDAKQCLNGTWVGRTGPNCEFICPVY